MKALGAAIAVWALSVPCSFASTLLLIDTSDTSAVTFTATTETATQYDAFGAFAGFTLQDFFGSAITEPIVYGLTGDLRTYGAVSAASRLGVASGDGDDDLNFFSWDVPVEIWYFYSTQTALSGSLTADLSSVAGALPGAGTSGSIITGYEPPAGAEVGRWQVLDATPVPLPGSLGLLLPALAGLAGMAARRRACRAGPIETPPTSL